VYGTKKRNVYIDKGGKCKNKMVIIEQCDLGLE
jgi:hypothetical protein